MARGRPKKNIDFDAIRELASENNTVSDICRVLELPRSTFYDSKQAQEAFENGRADMRVNLNHWQWLSAKTDPKMQVHLGKQVLGQSDNPVPDVQSAKITIRENGDIEVG